MATNTRPGLWTPDDLLKSPLMAHPMAAMAAGTAIGVGMAGHALGFWLGTIQGLLEISQKTGPAFDPDGALKPWHEGMRQTGPSSRGKADVTARNRPISDLEEHLTGAVSRATEFATIPAKAAADMATDATTNPAAAAAASAMPDTIAPEPEKMAAEGLSERRPGGRQARSAPTAAKAEIRSEVASQAKMRRPAGSKKPEAPDDLKQITGIGPKLEKVLNDLGFWTFAQLAALSAEEVAWIDDHLQLRGRIARDEWIEQAEALAKDAQRTSA